MEMVLGLFFFGGGDSVVWIVKHFLSNLLPFNLVSDIFILWSYFKFHVANFSFLVSEFCVLLRNISYYSKLYVCIHFHVSFFLVLFTFILFIHLEFTWCKESDGHPAITYVLSNG